MKKINSVKWLLFDRTITDPEDGFVYDKLSFSTAAMVTFPKIWRVGIRRMECGCAYRWPRKNHKVLICFPCVKENLGWTEEDIDE